jgi:hypothetical protein
LYLDGTMVLSDLLVGCITYLIPSLLPAWIMSR